MPRTYISIIKIRLFISYSTVSLYLGFFIKWHYFHFLHKSYRVQLKPTFPYLYGFLIALQYPLLNRFSMNFISHSIDFLKKR